METNSKLQCGLEIWKWKKRVTFSFHPYLPLHNFISSS